MESSHILVPIFLSLDGCVDIFPMAWCALTVYRLKIGFGRGNILNIFKYFLSYFRSLLWGWGGTEGDTNCTYVGFPLSVFHKDNLVIFILLVFISFCFFSWSLSFTPFTVFSAISNILLQMCPLHLLRF